MNSYESVRYDLIFGKVKGNTSLYQLRKTNENSKSKNLLESLKS